MLQMSEVQQVWGHKYERYLFREGSVSGSGIGPLDSDSMDPIPDLETQSLEVRYRIPSQQERCVYFKLIMVW